MNEDSLSLPALSFSRHSLVTLVEAVGAARVRVGCCTRLGEGSRAHDNHRFSTSAVA